MIESYYWRRALRTELRWLRLHRRHVRWSEKQVVLFERQVMIVAFEIRSLLERPKLSREAMLRTLAVTRYQKTGQKPVTKLNLLACDEHFALDRPIMTPLSAAQLCNQIIHHYIMFTVRQRPGMFTNLLVVSDYKRNECLFDIEIERFLNFLSFYTEERSLLGAEGRTVKTRWDERRQDYEFVESV